MTGPRMEILKKAGPHGLASHRPVEDVASQANFRNADLPTVPAIRTVSIFGAQNAWEPRAGGRLISEVLAVGALCRSVANAGSQ